ncbi:MAG: anacyclamide/piricyclamide family prenylated cyclic peptide [bacterium]|jgi:prenylated cyclic peptide (anacyclamide/piricyclamide family)|uniref:anacyclamide/piricyclamide family prenylated cyclic peptide n=1 Tax=Microcystis aeruginosa TaxID=1126 RepID=UPI00123045C1|nr:anacyclamide/piricyclamide family prenylated cyclic peptide [Microcystis aeruginosa]GCA84372.1 hypothetical protein MiHa_02343 [Microcystis aeruginosa NIES-2522]
MKTKKLTPRNAAPVQRKNTATVSRDGNAIIQLDWGTFCVQEDREGNCKEWYEVPFAGDDAE